MLNYTIQKTKKQERETKCGECGERSKSSLRFQVSLRGSEGCYHFNIPGNASKDSSKYYRRFLVMLKKILGTFQEDSRKCSTLLRSLFSKILGMVQEDSRVFKAKDLYLFLFLFLFCLFFAIKLLQSNGK